uniref:Protein kinase domain-containing protein n=1 Tax=Lactuca sativa TaxID=4236 RepID=A0A9R1VFD7_LACSA|nr:hypothetical protein LSAT_V11C500288580 [Lactuca sativa]
MVKTSSNMQLYPSKDHLYLPLSLLKSVLNELTQNNVPSQSREHHIGWLLNLYFKLVIASMLTYGVLGVTALFYIGTTNSHPPIPYNYSFEAQDLLLKCLHKEPEMRPFVSDLLQHPFVTGKSQPNSHVVAPTMQVVYERIREEMCG